MSVGQDNRWQKDAADQNFDYMFKLLIIGNSSVGKTSFLFRYADDSFTSAFVSTVGIDFKVKTVFRQDKRVKLQIWVRAVDLCWIFSLLSQHSTFGFAFFFIWKGHGRAGTVQDDHDSLLPRSYGILVDVRHHQRRIFQQRSRLVSCFSFLFCLLVWITHFCSAGAPKSRLILGITLKSSWSETNATWKTSASSPTRGVSSWLTNSAWSFSKLQPRRTSTSR